jgi:hypothetical protein
MTQVEAILPPLWRTRWLVVENSRLDEVDRLQALFNACSYVQPWDPIFSVLSRHEIVDLVSTSVAAASSIRGIRFAARIRTQAWYWQKRSMKAKRSR